MEELQDISKAVPPEEVPSNNGTVDDNAEYESLDDDLIHHAESEEQGQNADNEEFDREDSTPPDVPIQDFDWDDLEARYHEMIRSKAAEEDDVYADFDALCQFFGVWAETSVTREVDRSFKRLKTQSVYVRHEEHDLEQRRQHYVKVVAAFQTALSLLEA